MAIALDVISNGNNAASTQPAEHPSESGDRARERERFTELYRATYPIVVAACRRDLAGAGDAEAVAQEAFANAWRSWSSFTLDRPFLPWVLAIARRLCLSEHRRNGRRRVKHHHLANALVSGPWLLPEEVVEERDSGRRAVAAYGRLDLEHRRLLLLREIERRSHDEIASLEGTTPDAVRSKLYRARSALRAGFESVRVPASA